jgi:hypothetical protein
MCFCSRRSFSHGALALAGQAISASMCVSAQKRTELPLYCSLTSASFDANELISTSGDIRLDRSLIAELKHIIEIIPVSPGFKYIRDDSPNAFATNTTYVSNTRGSVLMGLNLIREEISRSENGGVAVAGICAHECGHIFQFFSSYSDQLRSNTAKYTELHADLIAGYYMGRRRQFSADRVAVFARSLFDKGDYGFNEPNHHGTPEQRFEAMKKGYEYGIGNSNFDEVVRSGAIFVRNMT